MERRLALVAMATTLAAALMAGCDYQPTVDPTPGGIATATGVASPTAGRTAILPPAPSEPAGSAPTESLAVLSDSFSFARGDDRPLPTTVWYPIQPGIYPVVVFGHGLGGAPVAYGQLLHRWAAAGFVVAAPAFPHTSLGVADFDVLDVLNQPADLSSVLDGLLALPGDNPVRQRLDGAHIAVAGHSAGAISAVGCFTEDGPGRRDPRFSAGVILAGSSIGVGEQFTGEPAAMLFVHAENDPVVPIRSGRTAYAAVPWPKAFLTLSGKEHTDPYVNPTNPQFDTVVAATTDFLRWRLYGDAAAAARLAALKDLDNRLRA